MVHTEPKLRRLGCSRLILWGYALRK